MSWVRFLRESTNASNAVYGRRVCGNVGGPSMNHPLGRRSGCGERSLYSESMSIAVAIRGARSKEVTAPSSGASL